jgi:hypothetical protein
MKALEGWTQQQSQPQTSEAWQEDLAAWPQQERLLKDCLAS